MPLILASACCFRNSDGLTYQRRRATLSTMNNEANFIDKRSLLFQR
jgi:hypothetical protein